MECRCDGLTVLHDGEAQTYSTEHLRANWMDMTRRRGGFTCPDSGQTWLMDYGGQERGPDSPRTLHRVTQREWRDAMPMIDDED
jgi:hypothetical protein